MQDEFDANYPELNIQILGLNEFGHESGNFLMPDHGDLPWLQDVDTNSNQVSDVWYEQWDIEYRDVVILDRDNVRVDAEPTIPGVQNYNLSIYDLGQTESYETLRDLFLQAASPKTNFELRLVESPTATSAVGEGPIPAGNNWADEWGSFYVEIWVETANSDTVGLREMALDLQFNPALVTARSLQFGPAFATGQGGVINNPAGRVDNIHASTSRTDVGDNAAVLLGRVEFTTISVPHNASGQYLQPHGVMEFTASETSAVTNVGPSLVEPTTPLSAHLMPVTYDLDDDGRIGFSDLAVFSATFLQNVGDSPESWAADFDRSGRVGFGDLALLSANFLTGSTTTQPLQHPANWPDPWLSATAPLFAAAPPLTGNPAANGASIRQAPIVSCDAYAVAELLAACELDDDEHEDRVDAFYAD